MPTRRSQFGLRGPFGPSATVAQLYPRSFSQACCLEASILEEALLASRVNLGFAKALAMDLLRAKRFQETATPLSPITVLHSTESLTGTATPHEEIKTLCTSNYTEEDTRVGLIIDIPAW